MKNMRAFCVWLLAAALSSPGVRAGAEERVVRSPRPSAERTPQPASATVGDASYSAVFARFDDPKTRASFQESLADFDRDGAFVYSSFESFADLFVKPERVSEIRGKVRKLGGWSMVGGSVAVPPPQVATVAGRARGGPEEIFRGDATFKGKGVLIAVIDSGIDFRHPDFAVTGPDQKRTSRLLYFWDTTRQPPPTGPGSKAKAKLTFPNGAPVGTLYTREELSAELNADAKERQIPDGDTNGHGTACAGIAAGNGTGNSQFTGVAPLADLIAVRVGREQFTFQHAFLLPALCGWIDEVAGGRPAVVSCSFGGQYGSHDGNMIDELQLNARFPLDRKGRALCIAAGNEGQDFIHSEISLKGDARQAKLSYRAAKGASIYLFLDGATAGDIKVDGDKLAVAGSEVNPITKCLQLELSASATDAKDSRELTISRTGTRELAGDAYILGESGAEFALGQVVRKQVGTPGTCDNAVTVGSYDWNNQFPLTATMNLNVRVMGRTDKGFEWDDMKVGQLSGYSSPGPLRRFASGGPAKPDIVAPGQYFIAPAADQIFEETQESVLRTQDRKYRDFNGTSAATPYTAGIVALLFEARPNLTLRELKELLRTNATRNAEVKKLPDFWGNGKLDRDAVRSMLDAARSGKP